MLMVAFRDLQWRRRRFVIAIIATGVVFAITLLLSGMDSGFKNETVRTVDAFHTDAWVVPRGAAGPFTSPTAFPGDVVREVAALPGVRRADPFVMTRVTWAHPAPKDVIVFGTPIGGIGPRVASGRAPRRAGEAAVDDSLGAGIGETILLSGRRLRVVGTFDGQTVFAGLATIVMPIADARALAYASQTLATAILTKGIPKRAPSGYKVLTNAAAIGDLRRPVKQATGTISFLNALLWLIAAGIIGSLVYLTVLERTRDFAVLKATGVSSRTIYWTLALEAVIMAWAAAAVAAALSAVLSPALTLRVEISTTAYVLLPVIAVIVGLLASLVGLRRAVSVDPALAFG